MSSFTQSHGQDAGDHEQQFLGQRLGLAPDNGHGEFGKPCLVASGKSGCDQRFLT
ncbi:hypothetical protein [Pseudarthrobacter sulfonivorans]|uniref:hypothetical protein n=1 Tax=Pseudarthrobacter sulfonivorans TaxID=121292 RepID=UPI0012FE3EBB|nr:hypothetical protein [Pseudarthrobacter sulfonivorans]